jgi:hypothetical protein
MLLVSHSHRYPTGISISAEAYVYINRIILHVLVLRIVHSAIDLRFVGDSSHPVVSITKLDGNFDYVVVSAYVFTMKPAEVQY